MGMILTWILSQRNRSRTTSLNHYLPTIHCIDPETTIRVHGTDMDIAQAIETYAHTKRIVRLSLSIPTFAIIKSIGIFVWSSERHHLDIPDSANTKAIAEGWTTRDHCL
jgi:hypothetical protein